MTDPRASERPPTLDHVLAQVAAMGLPENRCLPSGGYRQAAATFSVAGQDARKLSFTDDG
jgi:hypothetical protein